MLRLCFDGTWVSSCSKSGEIGKFLCVCFFNHPKCRYCHIVTDTTDILHTVHILCKNNLHLVILITTITNTWHRYTTFTPLGSGIWNEF